MTSSPNWPPLRARCLLICCGVVRVGSHRLNFLSQETASSKVASFGAVLGPADATEGKVGEINPPNRVHSIP